MEIVGGGDEEEISDDGSDVETESKELGGGRVGLGDMGFDDDDEEEEEDVQPLEAKERSSSGRRVALQWRSGEALMGRWRPAAALGGKEASGDSGLGSGGCRQWPGGAGAVADGAAPERSGGARKQQPQGDRWPQGAKRWSSAGGSQGVYREPQAGLSRAGGRQGP
ncbi:uncharacterized protein LOC131874276 [Cryptomeria japonica]|uniref:uncharacterized protein LOC131874276 n=1 Tax=Cryptomeria japonica TaxID=3369 RepID=UPI0027DA78AD|nr:uncharacterized protein LOC131874276 [Cryptomeria japonica]